MAFKNIDRNALAAAFDRAVDRINRCQIVCQYCHKDAVMVKGTEIYPHRPDLAKKNFWKCPGDCDAYVGTHMPNKSQGFTGIEPMGVLANAELRDAKMRAHAAFDPYWKKARIARHDAYRWLAEQLNVHHDQCHIGMFTVEQCEQVITAVRKMRDAVPDIGNLPWRDA